jgi:hypothetical protein
LHDEIEVFDPDGFALVHIGEILSDPLFRPSELKTLRNDAFLVIERISILSDFRGKFIETGHFQGFFLQNHSFILEFFLLIGVNAGL